MESLEIIKIRIKGILDCIDYYTSEPSIMNILNQCEKALNDNNLEILLFSCKEISKWYDKNINEICNNIYVHNKDTHRNNVNMVKDLILNLETILKNDNGKDTSLKICGLLSPDSVISNIVNNFHSVVKQLRFRHDNRATLDVSDEYDVQDLLHALLYINFDDIRDEEWTPSYAGKSSRQDFLLKNENIVIETKMTRKGLDAKKLGEELIIDIARYKVHPNCKTLICFVYDPEERIRNPRGIENDLTSHQDDLDVLVYIRPK